MKSVIVIQESDLIIIYKIQFLHQYIRLELKVLTNMKILILKNFTQAFSLLFLDFLFLVILAFQHNNQNQYSLTARTNCTKSEKNGFW